MSTVGHLWAIVQAHQDRYGPSISEIARRIGMSSSGVHAWNKRGVKAIPRVENLRALSELTGVPYDDVLQAALLDAGFVEEDNDPPPEEGYHVKGR